MTNTYSSGNAIVDFVGQMNFEGNIIPHTWYQTIKYETGKPNLNALVILSDLVYWYRPTIKRDERSNAVTFKKKFHEDLLQRNYDQIAETFGITKRQATDAVVFLEKLGVVKRHFRTIYVNGTKMSNVLFIELLSAGLKSVTFPIIQNGDTSHIETGDPLTLKRETSLHSNVTPPTLKRQTNTETSTEITTEITTEILNTNADVIPIDMDEPDWENVRLNKTAYEDVINYLNKQTGKRWKATSKVTKELIRRRYHDGFTLDDFQTVIDIKSKQWINDAEMSKYLRPETLFGNKFERYLNEKRDTVVLSDGKHYRFNEKDTARKDENLPF